MITVIIIGVVLWFVAHEFGKGVWNIAEDFEEGWKDHES